MILLRQSIHQYDSKTKIPLPSLNLEQGEDLLISGQSGSGKSTLLHVLAGLLRPTQGSLTIQDTDLYSLKESKRDRFRGKYIGIVLQQIHLVDALTVQKNLELAQYMAGAKVDPSKIKQICSELEIDDKLDSYIDELSQGQRQRVAIARAVVNQPVLLLADEPTSSLDDERAETVIQLLKTQAKRCKATLIISTHDQRVKNHFSNVINLDQLHREDA